MSTDLRTSVDIGAPPERVWQALVDFGTYSEWNPFITRAGGAAVVGERLTLDMQPVGARQVTVHPTVLESTPCRRLRWAGRIGMPGVFDAEHRFTLTDRTGGAVRLVQEERFTGVLVTFMARSLRRHTLPAFHAMNEALKHRVEGAQATGTG